MEIVQRRSESEQTVIISSWTKLEVLINPPNFIFVSFKFHLRPVVVVVVDDEPIGIRPQCGPSTEDKMCISCLLFLGRR